MFCGVCTLARLLAIWSIKRWEEKKGEEEEEKKSEAKFSAYIDSKNEIPAQSNAAKNKEEKRIKKKKDYQINFFF